jgi:hypothetical protein
MNERGKPDRDRGETPEPIELPDEPDLPRPGRGTEIYVDERDLYFEPELPRAGHGSEEE